MKKPTLHLMCNAHLDPVWQWRWEEGCSEAIATFENAVRMLHEHKTLIFNHNEALLYRWILRYEPDLFKEIQKLVRSGRWHISGGWYLQPDVNMPGTESLIRHMTEGRRFFERHFGVRPIVAYNFDSFGHSGGLPQMLKLAGYKMYIHMRPQNTEMSLPSDLYRWRGVDHSEILTYRIAVGLYHTERDNIAQRLQEGTELALRLNRDVPVFWGIGNHGGGATREDLARIGEFVQAEKRVRIVHSTPERLYSALKGLWRSCPIVEGDLQRVFVGCYTSLSRLKRKAQQSLAELSGVEALRTTTWWNIGQDYPEKELSEAWRDHLFNDFHDILSGSCTESAEQDALELYGRVSETVRHLRLSAVVRLKRGKRQKLYVPVTVVNSHPMSTAVPIEVECMLDHRPQWRGTWHLRLYDLSGKSIPCQEEQPESLLPFNGWRRKVVFFTPLKNIGTSRYELRITEGERQPETNTPLLRYYFDPASGLISHLGPGEGRECLKGPLLQPLVVKDEGDSWGTDQWSYRNVVGMFTPTSKRNIVVHSGEVRTVTESVFVYNQSRVVLRTISYPHWPVLEFHLRIHWNEIRKRLKLSVPTVFNAESLLCEIPGGAIYRPANGEEHVHGRWCYVEGLVQGRKTGLAVVNSGQHGIDFKEGEIRLSVMRSAAYCHEQGFPLGESPERKYMDTGIHDVRLLITVGDADEVRASLASLAEWLSAPPAVYSHLPIGGSDESDFLNLHPPTISALALKRASDGKTMILRLHETVGEPTKATIELWRPRKTVKLNFKPFEIKTIRIAKGAGWREVDLIDER